MATPKSVTTTYEVNFALRVLHYLHASSSNIYLLLAIIAWMRGVGGKTYIGNNPMDLAPGADDARYRSGVRTYQYEVNGKLRTGYYSVYATLDKGAAATARRLLVTPAYATVVKAAQRGSGATEADKQQQAVDFLNALALSAWDRNHYGLVGSPANFDQRTNTLITIWASLLGHPVNLPPTVTQPTPVVVKQPPQPPKRHEHLAQPIKTNYIDPYAAQHFYEARPNVAPTLPGDRPNG